DLQGRRAGLLRKCHRVIPLSPVHHGRISGFPLSNKHGIVPYMRTSWKIFANGAEVTFIEARLASRNLQIPWLPVARARLAPDFPTRALGVLVPGKVGLQLRPQRFHHCGVLALGDDVFALAGVPLAVVKLVGEVTVGSGIALYILV